MAKIHPGVPAGSFGEDWLATAFEHGWAIGAGMILLGAGMLAMIVSRSREMAARENAARDADSDWSDRGPGHGHRARPHPPTHSEDRPTGGT